MFSESVVCPICKVADAEQAFLLPDREYPGDETFRIVRCRRCGLHYVDPRPSLIDMSRYYPSDYECYLKPASDDLPLFSRNPLKRRAKELTLRLHYGYREFPPAGCLASGVWLLTRPLLSRFGQVMPALGDRRILDVGCGTGALLSAQLKLGWQTWGVEVSPQAAAQARAAGHQVHQGQLQDAGFPSDTFDLVVFNHSLEHIHDPTAALVQAFRVLRPGGRVFVALPNAGSIHRRLLGASWFPWGPPRHLWHFDAQTLGRLLRQCGLRPLSWSTPSPDGVLWRSLIIRRYHGVPPADWMDEYAPRWFRYLAKPWLMTLKWIRCGDDLEMWAEKPIP